jgi:hypothetical protein
MTKKKEGNHMNAGKRRYKKALTIVVAAVSAAFILGGAGAAYAAGPTSSDDWTNPKYEKKIDDGQDPAAISVEGGIYPREKGGGSIVTPPKEDEPEPPVTPPPTEEKPETPGVTPPKDGGTPSGDKASPGSAPDGVTTRPVANVVTRYPDNGPSTVPGAVDVPGNGGNGGPAGSVIDEGNAPRGPGVGADARFPLRGDNWSMANALFAVISLIAAFVCTIFFVARRREEGKEVDGERRRKRLWLTVSLAAAAASAALFMLTQDITRSMVLFDKWSAAFGVLAAAGVIAVRFAYAKKPAEA